MAAFGYMLGMALFAVLYLVGMRITEFINPHPTPCPSDRDYKRTEKCKVEIRGKILNCIKEVYVSESYYYNRDYDTIKRKTEHRKYIFENPLSINDFTDKINFDCMVAENGTYIKCYAGSGFKALIAYETETLDSVYAYRKPFRKKLST